MNFSIEHLGLPARDPAGLRDWYARTLGAKLVFDTNGSPPYMLSLANGAMIEIYQADCSLPETGNNKLSGWRHVALKVQSIEAAKAELEKHGVRFTEDIKPAAGGGRVLFFSDPEGNLLHFVERDRDF